MKIGLAVPADFDFRRTVFSHGWCTLTPFGVAEGRGSLELAIELAGGRVVVLSITARPDGGLTIELPGVQSLGDGEKKETVVIVRSCLRLQEDYSEFYGLARRQKGFRWVSSSGAGRLLRSPTVFEDVVKMICTTNCSWALTQSMVGNLCRTLGSPAGEGKFTFPTPKALASSTEKFLRTDVRAGYRSPYLLELSRRVASGELDIEAWRRVQLPPSELYERISSVKGVGPYAAGNILRLLGHYEHLAIDSWCRKQFFKIHRKGRKTTDRAIERHYAPLGRWKGLFFWMDLTKEWYEKEFPF